MENMKVYELIKMFVNEKAQYFRLCDNKKGEIIFKGYYSDLNEELKNATITSIDNVDWSVNGVSLNAYGITLNIDID